MTKDEALKLALAALEGVLDDSPSVLDASISGGLYEVVQCRDAIAALKKALSQPAQEPVAWMNNKDFEPIRVRIMQEAYELADRNDSEGYNAIKVMCGDVQMMLPPQPAQELDEAAIRADERDKYEAQFKKLMRLHELRESQPNKPCCLAEREACAKLCESHVSYPSRLHFAAAIRARGNT